MINEEMEKFCKSRGNFIERDGKRITAYDIRTITLEQFRMLIAYGNDSHNNQIRVTKSGMVYLSEDIVGSGQLDDVAFGFETFCAGNGYVGAGAAGDDSHVIPLFNALMDNWAKGAGNAAYIDSF